MRSLHIIQGLFVLCVAVQGNAATGETPALQVNVVPDTVDVAVGNRVVALLTLRNVSSKMLSHVQITPIAMRGVQVAGDPPLSKVQQLSPSGSQVWTLTFSSDEATNATGTTVPLRIDYVQGTGSQARSYVAYGVIKFTARELDQVVDIKIESARDSLSEYQPLTLYLVATNKSDRTIRIERVVPEKPSFISVTTAKDTVDPTGLELQPHKSALISYKAKADGNIETGKHLLIFTVEYVVGDPPVARATRSVVVSKTIDVGVLGEAETLKLLLLPSVIIAPGFVAIMTGSMLWSWGLFRNPRREQGWSPFAYAQQPLTPQYWIAVITASIFLVPAYLAIYPNFLTAHGTEDLIKMWFFSMLVGFIVYSAMVYGHQWYLDMRTPKEDDDQIEILRKLGRQGLGVSVAKVKTAKGMWGLLLQKPEKVGETSWIGPPIVAEWQWSTPEGEGADKLKQLVEAQLEPLGGSPTKLADLLKRAKCKGWAGVGWTRDDGWVSGVQEEKTAELVSDGSRDVIVSSQLKEGNPP